MDADDPLERLHDACASGDLAAARAASDADLNAVDAEGQSALHHACAGGHLDVVLHVLDRAAPGACNLRDANDMTPFHLACEGGHLDVVRRLAAHPGLDRNLRATRRTSYFLASRHDHAEVCRLLEQLEREDGPEEATTSTRRTMRTVDSDRGGEASPSAREPPKRTTRASATCRDERERNAPRASSLRPGPPTKTEKTSHSLRRNHHFLRRT